jgi:anti-sigma regulatory factor (Ser/Thr protein kinase)
VTATDVVSRYEADTHSPGEARRAIRAFCAANEIENLSDDAELLGSEVMTNACRMASGPVTMFLLADDGALVVIITDDSANRLPATTVLSPPMAESGRGLFVLDQLAGAWGTTSTPSGKNVWFRLP